MNYRMFVNFLCLLFLASILTGCGETKIELTDVEEQTSEAPVALSSRRPSSLSTKYPVGEFTDPVHDVINVSVGEEPGFDGSYVELSGRDKHRFKHVTIDPLTKGEVTGLLAHLNVLRDEFLKIDTSRDVEKDLPRFSLPNGHLASSLTVKDGKKSGAMFLMKGEQG